MILAGGLDGADLTSLFIVIYSVWLVPPILLGIIGFLCRKRNKEMSKSVYLLAVLYLLVGAGICFGML